MSRAVKKAARKSGATVLFPLRDMANMIVRSLAPLVNKCHVLINRSGGWVEKEPFTAESAQYRVLCNLYATSYCDSVKLSSCRMKWH